MAKRKSTAKPPKRSSPANPNKPAPPPGLPNGGERQQAAQVTNQYLNMYVYELQRNGASPDFIKKVQSETTWALNVLAAPPAPQPTTEEQPPEG
jgi:hypothetical protein